MGHLIRPPMRKGIFGYMKSYYTEERAQAYNRTWKVFTQKTLDATCSSIDFTRIQKSRDKRAQAVRILDVACGTGTLLKRLAERLPGAELYGIDASQGMLTQAHELLKHTHNLHLAQTSLRPADRAGLSYEPGSFDLITCTNTFHYLAEPVSVLRGLVQLLAPEGQLIIEDYARHGPAYLWIPFEWLIKRVDPQHVRALTLPEAQGLCDTVAALQILDAKTFPVSFIWQGWLIRAEG